MKETARQVCVAKTFALACAVASVGIGSLQAADAYIYDTAGEPPISAPKRRSNNSAIRSASSSARVR